MSSKGYNLDTLHQLYQQVSELVGQAASQTGGITQGEAEWWAEMLFMAVEEGLEGATVD